uniref:Uncharacterized protein n=1 Tax=Aureoumbra lagunensis TaxID=44058 RepID=A0A7S3NP31_9STRA|mmetsp:Transcript_9159/g.14115  ORF Transcript_9159/g.14115 Transcript_9159/m.14115 type:complete len:587 (+) Transcript_9159:39-1799(+)|eukprot:CAMPEP_0197315642 /NCGR_PEP_ID=MMETSP0891-20130614/39231_1 /TAXON_ID=44058 ORGANISM="Aureoumbra lagunensis, Strain CCMP1510" /NCGR_SAMPLE_ID=MMETSP0891 /ASSEMBLY_ACC=CAM_ASM_000534 /LENGTH=586 /DNA_ID=CAMNT_0042804737 /DNA_START=1 /DNA_END=1761 /DNA_ORIENTATION=-
MYVSSNDDGRRQLVEVMSGWIFNNIIGSLAGLLFAYVVILQFDPELQCPTDGCWQVALALWIWAICGVVTLPWLSLLAMRTLRPFGIYSSRLVWEDATLSKARELVARGMGTAWSVGLYSALAATVRQVEYDALQNMGILARCGDLGVACALKGVLILTGFALAIAITVTACAVAAIAFSTRLLSKPNMSPLVVEMCLMIRGNLFYTVAYAWTTTLGLLWFAPYELGPAADNALSPSTHVNNWNGAVRAAFAAARALTLIVLFGHIALYALPDPPHEAEVEASPDASLTHCATLLAFKACAVVVALAANDAAQGIIADYEQYYYLSDDHAQNENQSDSIRSSSSQHHFDFRLTLSGFVYGAFLLLVGAVYFLACFSRPRRYDHAGESRRLVGSEINGPDSSELDYSYSSKSPHNYPVETKLFRFGRLVYAWLAIFATWSPWKRLLIALYAELGNMVGPVFLLPFQISLAIVVSLFLALLQVTIDKFLHFTCGLYCCTSQETAVLRERTSRKFVDGLGASDRASSKSPFVVAHLPNHNDHESDANCNNNTLPKGCFLPAAAGDNSNPFLTSTTTSTFHNDNDRDALF